MNTQAFEEQYAIWFQAEKLVLSHIQSKYPQAHKTELKTKDWDIFVPELWITIEVKYDKKSEKTGNFLIETFYNWKPSGILTTKSDWWAIVDKWIHYFPTSYLRNVIKSKKLKQIEFKGGDNEPMKGFLIKTHDLVPM